MNIFADRLKKIRKKNKISQRALSNELNISQSQISKYEKGIDTPSGNILIKMAQFLNVSTEYLLGIISHFDIESQYNYMREKRQSLFTSPEGKLTYKYHFNNKTQTSILSYVFSVFSTPETKVPNWQNPGKTINHPAENYPILYLKEK